MLVNKTDCCHSVSQSCPTLCHPMDCSTLGFPVLHHLMELAQTHVHWVGDTIQPSHPLFSPFSCLQSFLASGSFLMSWLFTSGGLSIGASASASVLPMNIQGLFPLGLTVLISLQAKGLSRVFSNTTIQKLTVSVIGSSDNKESAYSAGDLCSIPRSGRSPGEGIGNPLQYSCLENPIDWGSWQATVYGVAKSQTCLSN